MNDHPLVDFLVAITSCLLLLNNRVPTVERRVEDLLLGQVKEKK
jgi:hypothetical protein